MPSAFRLLPAVHRLLASPQLTAAAARLGRQPVRQECQAALDELRRRIAGGQLAAEEVPAACESLPEDVLARLEAATRPAYRPVINATGVLLHTNLGRAPLGSAMPAHLASYLALEYDIEVGRRGQRLAPLAARLARLFAAEAAVMVNNNAAALLLLLSGHALGREVIVSRSQLIEIGGSFRLPAVMASSGAILREVGCTNRTHLADYERAVCPETSAILIAHQSNFRIEGFTTSPSPAEVAALAHRHDLPLFIDQGSGNLHDLRRWGLPHEPTVDELLAAGADIVCFSGDKLLGGPQAGVLVGRAQWIEPLARHPLYRALRPDKTALLLMDQVLHFHQTGQLHRIPLYAMLETPLSALKSRARRLGRRLRQQEVPVKGCATRAAVGGGTTPRETIASYGLAVPGGDRMAELLRRGEPPVIGHLEDDQVLLDLRSVQPAEDRQLETAVATAYSRFHRSQETGT